MEFNQKLSFDVFVHEHISSSIRDAIEKSVGPQDVFRHVWNSVNAALSIAARTGCQFSCRDWAFTNFRLSTEELLLLKIVIQLRKRKIKYQLSIKIKEPKILGLIRTINSPILVTSIHNGFAFSGTVLGKNGRHVTTISSDPNISDILARSGLTDNVNIISNDKFCLYNLYQTARKSTDAICCAIDFKGDGISYDLLSVGLFGFAKKYNIPLFFLKSWVDQSGNVLIDMKACPELSNTNAIAEDFVNFINADLAIAKNYQIDAYKHER